MTYRLSISRKIFYSVLVTVVFFALLETGARLFEPVPEGKTSAASRREDGKSAVFRVLVFGGSTVAGNPVAEFAFASQLEFWLRELHPQRPLAIHNFGRASKSSTYVRRMVERTQALKPDLLIVLTGHNEFLSTYIESELERRMEQFALVRTVKRLRDQARSTGPPPHRIEVMPKYRTPFNRAAPLFTRKLEKYADNLQHMTRLSQKKRIPIVFVTAPSNTADWPPAHRDFAWDDYHDPEYEPARRAVSGLIDSGFWAQAGDSLEQLLTRYPEDAMLLYLRGRVEVARGDHDAAGTLFIRAKDSDPGPWRAPSELNQLIREAAVGDGVHLADAEAIFRKHADNGLVGFALVADNAHPTPLGHAIICREVMRIIDTNDWLSTDGVSRRSVRDQLDYFMTHATDPATRKELELQYSLRNAKYCMTTPFYNYNAASMYLERALETKPDDWRVWANVATVSLLEDRIIEGRTQLVKAIELRGGPMDLQDRETTPYLREALERVGIKQEELSLPNRAPRGE